MLQITFSPDGHYLASSSVLQRFLGMISQTTIRVWEIATGKESCVLQDGREGPLAFSANSKLLAYKTSTHIRLWDIQNATENSAYRCDLIKIASLAFLHNGELRATAYSAEGRLCIWKPDTGSRALPIPPSYRRPMASFPDGRLVVLSNMGSSVKIWDSEDTAASTELFSLDKARNKLRDLKNSAFDTVLRGLSPRIASRLPDPFAYPHPTGYVVLAQGGTIMAAEYGDKSVRLFDLRTGENISVIRGFYDSVDSLSFSSDGKLLIYLADDKFIRLWDTEKGADRHTLQTLWLVDVLRLSPDGKLFAIMFDKKLIEIWDVATWKQRCTLKLQQADRQETVIRAFSPDGSLLMTWNGFYIEFWNTSNGTCQMSWDGLHSEYMLPLATFSPNGRKVAFALEESQTIQLFEVMTHELQNKFEELDQTLGSWTKISFSPEGKFFAYNTESKIHLCDAETGVKLYSVLLRAEIFELAFLLCDRGFLFVTDRGRYCFNPLPNPQKPRSMDVFASESWIQFDGEDVLCIHPDYRDRMQFVVNRTVVFNDRGFDGELKSEILLELGHDKPWM